MANATIDVVVKIADLEPIKQFIEEQDEKIVLLTDTLEKLISHALDCEKKLDEFHGLGNDAGSGCSVNICDAYSVVMKVKGLQ